MKKTLRTARAFLLDLLAPLGGLPTHPLVLALIVAGVTAYQQLGAEQREWLWNLPYYHLVDGLLIATVYGLVVLLLRDHLRASERSLRRPPEPLSDETVRRSAVHEAGHLLALSLLPLPPAKVRAQLRTAERSGHVWFELDGPVDAARSRVLMMVALAGQAAEQLVYGEVHAEGADDNRLWERLAKRHLSAGFAPECAWFNDPQSEGEARVNLKTLASIRGEHMGRLSRFMEANAHQLDAVAAKLREAGTVETEQALPLLKNVATVVA